MATPFGANPGTLDGVDFFDGTATKGMIVWKTAGTYSITPSEAADVEVLVVAGGGGGGSNLAGAGGAGGLLHTLAFGVVTSPTEVVVGAGGAGATNGTGSDGAESKFSSIASAGGGGGGKGSSGATNGRNGGSGGGGAANNVGAATFGGAGNTPATVPSQGNNGGDGGSDVSNQWAGAGGGGVVGVGGSGLSGSSGYGGDGGAGIDKFGTGYSGGGGGSKYGSGSAGTATHGGGNGGTESPTAQAGTANSGGGGGAAAVASHVGGSGGSGIVIVRWGGYRDEYDPDGDVVTRGLPESATISDAWSIRSGNIPLPGEFAALSDAWSIRSPRRQLPDESAAISDSWQSLTEYDAPMPEAAEISDSWQALTEFAAPMPEAAGISDSWEIFNWTKFVEERLPSLVPRYIAAIGTRTGDRFNPYIYSDYSISSMQFRQSFGALTYAQFVLPGVGELLNLPQAASLRPIRFRIDYATMAGVVIHSEVFITLWFSDWTSHRGGVNSSIAVECRSISVWSGSNTVTLTPSELSYVTMSRGSMNYITSSGGTGLFVENARFRFHRLDPFIRLGTRVVFEGNTYYIQEIVFWVGGDAVPTTEIKGIRLI